MQISGKKYMIEKYKPMAMYTLKGELDVGGCITPLKYLIEL
jgi:hypothetical protein